MSESLQEMLLEAAKNAQKKMAEEGYSIESIQAKLEEAFPAALNAIINQSSETVVTDMQAHMFEYCAELEAFDDEFLARHKQKWGRGFVASRTMYYMAIDAAEMYSDYVVKNIDQNAFQRKQYTFLSLQHIQARSCQQFLEVLVLMKEGFADAAYARWRSMFELACFASFIKHNGETIAKQYFEQRNSENQSIKHWTQGIKDKSGKKINLFAQILDMVDLDPAWKEQYKLACLVTHASPQGTFGRMANGPSNKKIPIGRSDFGLVTPAVHSALMLQWVSGVFLTLYPYVDSMAWAKSLTAWAEYVKNVYHSIYDEIFKGLSDEEQEDDAPKPNEA